MLDLVHASDVVESNAGRGRALEANFDQRIVAGPLAEQFVGGVGDLVGSAGSSRPGHSGRGALERRGAAVITASAVASVGAVNRTRDA